MSVGVRCRKHLMALEWPIACFRKIPEMSNCCGDSRADKRNQFAPVARRAHRRIALLAAGAVLLIGGYLLFGRSGGAEAKQVAPVTASISIPASDVSDGKAKFFQYAAADGRQVKFFVMKSSDGMYRAALDACDVCYPGKQGYEQSGDDMVCRKCGRRFASKLINEVSGGCNPIGVPSKVENGKIVINASDLDAGKAYF